MEYIGVLMVAISALYAGHQSGIDAEPFHADYWLSCLAAFTGSLLIVVF